MELIKEILAKYVHESENYDRFREQFVNIYGEVAKSNDPEALQLCRAIEWELADYSEGLISEALLRQSLSGLLGEKGQSQTVAAAVTISHPIAVRLVRSGTVPLNDVVASNPYQNTFPTSGVGTLQLPRTRTTPRALAVA